MWTKKFPKDYTDNIAALYSAVAATPFSIAAVSNIVETAALTTYFSSVALNYGTPDATRVLTALIPSRNSGGYQNVASVTFSTTPGTFGVRSVNSNNDGTELWYALVPSGSSGVTTVTFAGAQSRAAMQLYAIYAPSTVAPSATAVSTASAPTANITIPAGGCAVGAAFSLSGGPSTPFGLPAGFTIVDLNSNIATTQMAWAIHSSAGAVTGSTTLTMNLVSSGATVVGAVFAAWGP